MPRFARKTQMKTHFFLSLLADAKVKYKSNIILLDRCHLRIYRGSLSVSCFGGKLYKIKKGIYVQSYCVARKEASKHIEMTKSSLR